MGTQIGSLYTSLTLESASFMVNLKKAANVAETNTAKIQKQLSGLATGLKGAAAVLGAGVFLDAAKRALDYAGSLGETAQQLGVTTRELQVYRFAASQAGQSQEEMENGLQKLTRTIGEAGAGSKAQATTFRDLGIAVRDTNGKMLTTGDILPRVADALARVADPATRAKVEVDLFGKAGQKLDPLLTSGSKGIAAFADEAEKAGLILSDSLADGADRAADKLDELKQELEARLAKAVAENADSIVLLADAFGKLITLIGTAISNIREFGFQSGQALRAARGWTVFGGRVSGEAAMRARHDYFEAAVQHDDEKSAGPKGPLTQAVRPGALPTVAGGRKARDKSQELEERFAKELASLNDDALQIKIQFTTDLRAQAALEHERRNAEQAQFNADVDKRVAEEKLTGLQAKALKAAEDRKADQQKREINWKLDDDLTREELRTREESVGLQTDLLRGDLAGARTQADRRVIELKLLDLEYDRQRAALEAVLALHSSTEAEKEIARARLAQLDVLKANDKRQAVERTNGPLAQFINEMPKTAAEINEAYQHVAVDGLKSLNDGLVDAIVNSKSLADVFSNVANQIIADILRIVIQQTLIKPLAGLLGGSGDDSGSGGGLLGSLLGGLSGGASGGQKGNLFSWQGVTRGGGFSVPGPMSLIGFANGGSFTIGGNPGIDRNVLAINGIPAARVGYGERVTVTAANDRGGANARPIVFDLTNAVMTPDLLVQMQAIANETSGRVVGGEMRRQALARSRTIGG